jgi:hypothetical protein
MDLMRSQDIDNPGAVQKYFVCQQDLDRKCGLKSGNFGVGGVSWIAGNTW